MISDQLQEEIRRQMRIINYHEQAAAAAQAHIDSLKERLWDAQYEEEERARANDEGEYWKRNL